jgi:hypothetical protein
MKNLTREITKFKTLRCINKNTFDYVEINVPRSLNIAGSIWYVLHTAYAYVKGWSTITGWSDDSPNDDPDFHYYAVFYTKEQAKLINCDDYEKYPLNNIGSLFIPGYMNKYIILDIDLITNKPTKESLEKTGITEEMFFAYIDRVHVRFTM